MTIRDRQEALADAATENFFDAEADLIAAIKADHDTGGQHGREWRARGEAFQRMLAAHKRGGGYLGGAA
jgi:hypothetical protein